MGSEAAVKISIEDVGKRFVDRASGRRVDALTDISLTVAESEFLVLIGPSGCGKSTLLHTIAGFERPSAGIIHLDGNPILGPGPDRGVVFQEFALYPWRTVLGNVAFGLELQGLSRRVARERAMYYIEMVGLQGFEHAYPHTLSGGMKQRVGIARSLAYDPEVLLMDEPFGALDAQTRKLMQEELIRIWERARKTVVFVTHSVIEAVFLADRIVVMTARPGKVKGVVGVELPRPRDYTSEGFLAARKRVLNLLEEEVKRAVVNE